MEIPKSKYYKLKSLMAINFEEELDFQRNFLDMKIKIKRLIKELKAGIKENKDVGLIIKQLENTLDWYY